MECKILCSKVNDGNMSFKYGDKNDVLKNKTNFFDQNNIKNSILMKINYSDKIQIVENIEENEIFSDCLITKIPNLFLYINFADCIPMILFDNVQNILAIVHLGWQSIELNLHTKVIQHFIDNFNSKKENLIVTLGPSIKKDSYILKNPSQLKFECWNNYLENIGNDYYKIDLNKYVVDSIIKTGVENIINSNIDTATNKNYFSHYRTVYIDKNEKEGRFIFGAYIKE